MNKIVKKTAVLLLLIVCFFQSGCSKLTISTNLLSPPEFSNEYEAIRKILKAATYSTGSISLQSPKSGQYRSSITIFNESNSKSAVAFYKNKLQKITDKHELRMAVFSKTDGKWNFVWDMPCENEEIDKIIFTKNKSNANPYLIVGFSSKQNNQSIYNVYDFNVNNFHIIYSGKYQAMELCDINSDGIKELITIGTYDKDAINNESYKVTNKISTSPSTTKAIINSFSGDNVVLWGDADMAATTKNYTKISMDNKTFNKPAMFIDSKIDSNCFVTEILTFEENRLKNITVENDMLYKTKRTFAQAAYDIDNDGCIEIPITKSFPGYSKLNLIKDQNSVPFITSWYKILNNKLNFVNDTYIDYLHEFGINLPSEWKNVVSAKFSQKNEKTEFFIFKNSLEYDEEKLLTLNVKNLKDNKEKLEDYFTLASKKPMLYMAKINDPEKLSNKSLQITKKQILKSFFTINNY